jgi:hypothetical protein
MDHAFDLPARLAKVQQQANSQIGRFQIIGALHSMRVGQRFDRLQLDQKRVVDQQVHEILYQDVFVVQPITRPDNSFSSLLSACSACIVFLHLR